MGLITENKTGADCSGTTGQTNRVLTLANVAMTQVNGFMVFKDGALLTLTTNYTLSHKATGTTVTYLDALDDAAVLIVQYVQGSQSSTAYCNYTDVYNRTGLSTAEVASAVVDVLIDDTTAEIETLTGRKFTNANAIVQYFEIGKEDVIGNKQTTVVLQNYPVQSITECLALDMDGNTTATFGTLSAGDIASGTYLTTDYWLDTSEDSLTNTDIPNGTIIYKTQAFSQGVQKIKVTGTYGYGTVPQAVNALAACLAGIRCWIRFMGGSYNRLDSYGIPQQNVSKGSFYDRCKSNIEVLKEEAERLLDRIGRRPRVLFYATGQNR